MSQEGEEGEGGEGGEEEDEEEEEEEEEERLAPSSFAASSPAMSVEALPSPNFLLQSATSSPGSAPVLALHSASRSASPNPLYWYTFTHPNGQCRHLFPQHAPRFACTQEGVTL
jgi:hypothetical protein